MEAKSNSQGLGSTDFKNILLELFVRNWWLFLILITLGLFVGGLYAKSLPRTYEASSLLQFSAGGGGISTRVFGNRNRNTRRQAEVVIKSRLVAGKVIKKLGLDTTITPEYFPVIGKYIFTYYKHQGDKGKLSKLAFWQDPKYAWGGESVQLGEFVVPDEFLNRNFTLKILDASTASLMSGGKQILQAKVGKRVESDNFSIKINTISARSGMKFNIKKASIVQALNKITENLKVYPKAGDAILEVLLEYDNKDELVQILNNLVLSLMRHLDNQETADLIENMKVIEDQLPLIQTRLQKAEAAYQNFLRENNFASEGAGVKSVIESLAITEQRLDDAKNNKKELKKIYTAKHPAILELTVTIGRLESEINKLKTSAQALPELQLKAFSLKREMEAARKLRLDLNEQLQSLKVLQVSKLKKMSVLDYAIKPEGFVAPSIQKTKILFALLGALAAFALAYLRYIRSSVLIETPKDLSGVTDIPVWADVPFAISQKDLHKTGKIIAETDPYGAVAESMRSLRSVINLHLIQSKNRMISITSPLPRSGKSFVTMNLGYLLAKQHKRVLMVDADMRKGQMTTELKFSGKKGLREYLDGSLSEVSDVIHQTKHENLSIIPSGSRSNVSSDILVSDRFRKLAEYAKENFDIVVFDTPPLLALTDAATIGREVDCNILALPQKRSTKFEVQAVLRRSNLAGVKFDGILLNKTEVSVASKYYHKYMPYKYGYKYGKYAHDTGYGYMYGNNQYYKYDGSYAYDAEEEQKKSA